MVHLLKGKVAIVTGAGKGLGRSEAVALARQGARVVVSDSASEKQSIDEVVEMIQQDGGEAIGVLGDAGIYKAAKKAIETAIGKWGKLNILICNADIIRDKMLFHMTEGEWDTVIHAHLKGHFNYIVQAAAYWHALSKERGGPVYGRIISTSSEASLFMPPGQANYAAAKAGITALGISAGQSLRRYGVTSNIICPRASMNMDETLFKQEKAWDDMSVDNVSPLIVYLASPMAEQITGHVFVVHGKMVQMIDPPALGKKFENKEPWTVHALHEKLSGYFEKLEPFQGGFTL